MEFFISDSVLRLQKKHLLFYDDYDDHFDPNRFGQTFSNNKKKLKIFSVNNNIGIAGLVSLQDNKQKTELNYHHLAKPMTLLTYLSTHNYDI